MKQILQDKFELKHDGLYSKKTGLRAGCQRKDGYRNIYVNGKTYLEHRLVWCYVHGYMPTELDHIDRNKSNNSLTNLRECSRSENNLNKGLQSNNKIGIAGVYFHKHSQKYRAEIKRLGKVTSLGYFNTIQEAIDARKIAETGR